MLIPDRMRFFTPLQAAIAVFIGAFFAAGYVLFHNRRAAGEGYAARGSLFAWVAAGYGFLFILPLFPYVIYIMSPILCVCAYILCRRFFTDAESTPQSCAFISAIAAGVAALIMYAALAYVTYRIISIIFYAGV